MKYGYVPLKGSRRRNGGGLKGRQAAKYNFLKLRNMEEILSTKYRHLPSCERNSQGVEKKPPAQTDALR